MEFRALEQVPAYNGDAATKPAQSLWCSNESSHLMATFKRLPDDLQTRTPCGT